MGRCLTVTFILSGVLLAGIGYFLYDPLPSHLDNVWQMRYNVARLKVKFILNEFNILLGKTTRMAAFRDLMEGMFPCPLTEPDKQQLEIYDTKLDGVPVRVYKPKSAKGLLPGLVFYHGGGWVLFNVPSYDGQSAHIARTANIIVISVEYRLAPEFPFPAGFDDCYKATVQVLKKGKDLGVDTSKVVIGGDSAGGNFAAAVSLRLRDAKVKPPLKAQIVIYGALHFCELSLPSCKIQDEYDPTGIQQYAFFLKFYFNLTDSQTGIVTSLKFLTPEHEEKCFRNVDYKLLPKELIPEGHTRGDQHAVVVNDDVKLLNSYLTDLRFAPLLADDLSNLPATFVLAAGWDRLRDENIIYAERIRKTGTPVQVLYIPNTFHGIFNNYQEESGFVNGPKVMRGVISFINKYVK